MVVLVVVVVPTVPRWYLLGHSPSLVSSIHRLPTHHRPTRRSSVCLLRPAGTADMPLAPPARMPRHCTSPSPVALHMASPTPATTHFAGPIWLISTFGPGHALRARLEQKDSKPIHPSADRGLAGPPTIPCFIAVGLVSSARNLALTLTVTFGMLQTRDANPAVRRVEGGYRRSAAVCFVCCAKHTYTHIHVLYRSAASMAFLVGSVRRFWSR